MQVTRTVAAAFVAVIAAGALALGAAAPAEAFQAPPVKPPKLNAPSSTIGAATGGNAKAGAQLGGQLANSGTKAAPAFAAGGLGKVVGNGVQLISGYNLGTSIGQLVSSQFGIDANQTVCTGTGTDAVGQVMRSLSGSDCSVYDMPSTYQPNTDAVAQPAGWGAYPQPWGCSGKDPAGGTCYGYYTFSPQPAKQSGAQSLVMTHVSGAAQSNVFAAAWCRNPTGGAISWATLTGNPLNFGALPNGTPQSGTFTVTCASPLTLYAFGVSSSNLQGSGSFANPDTQALAYMGRNSMWFSGDSPNYTQGQTADPSRWLTCTIRATDGTVKSATSDTFKESSGKLAPLRCPTLDAGKTAGHMTITLNGGPQVLTLYDQDSTQAYQAANAAYPLCANGACQLDLLDGTGSCYDGDSERCATWVNDPNRDQKYKCKYGTYDVPLSECFALGNAFDLAKVAAGNGIADPNTGKDTGEQTSVKPDPGGAPDPADGGETREPCFPSGWGAFNPLNWVLQPVKCALNWAFVPRASKVSDFQNDVNGKWRASTPGKYMVALSSFTTALGSFTSDGGCSGLTVDLSGIAPGVLHLGSYRFLPACPGDFFAPFAPPLKALIGVSFVVGGFFGVKRITAGLVNQGNE